MISIWGLLPSSLDISGYVEEVMISIHIESNIPDDHALIILKLCFGNYQGKW